MYLTILKNRKWFVDSELLWYFEKCVILFLFRVVILCVLVTAVIVGIQYKMCMQTLEQKQFVQTITMLSKNTPGKNLNPTFQYDEPAENEKEKVTSSHISRKLKVNSETDKSLGVKNFLNTMLNQPIKTGEAINSVTRMSGQLKKCAKPRTRIAFLKTHKTAGSTIENILQRYGHFKNLTFVMPFKELDKYRYNYIGGSGDTITLQNIIPKREEDEYEILCNHVVFNEASFHDILPDDTFLFTIIREPFAQFISTLDYYGYSPSGYIAKILNLGVSDPLSVYLHSPWRYEPSDPYFSMTNNRMSVDLGVPKNLLRNGTFLKSYFTNINSVFNLVLLREYFDESLILLKRYTCWSFRDIVYTRHNVWPFKRKYNLTVDAINSHRKWNVADYMLYETFHKIFWDKVTEEKEFFDEVFHFKKIQKKVDIFCFSGQQRNGLTIYDSKWSPGFVVTSEDCMYIRMGEKEFISILHKKMMSRVFPSGYTFTQATTVFQDRANLFN